MGNRKDTCGSEKCAHFFVSTTNVGDCGTSPAMSQIVTAGGDDAPEATVWTPVETPDVTDSNFSPPSYGYKYYHQNAAYCVESPLIDGGAYRFMGKDKASLCDKCGKGPKAEFYSWNK